MNGISDLLALRLANQNLTGPGLDSPEQVVARLGAVQSQDYAAAKWALAQRVRAATDASIEQAFNEGRILRTHVLRPTWHFVLPSEIRWMLKLTAPRVRALMAYNNRRLGLDSAILKRSNAVIAKTLRGKQLKRDELNLALERAGIDTSGLRSSHILMHVELEGLICSGTRRGKQHTYALLDERAPAAAEISRDEALAGLARLYFTGHGPATVRDFSWWSGLTLTDARRGLEALGSELERAELEGSQYWWFPSIHAPRKPSGGRLLPNFDEYTVAYTDRDAFFDSGYDAGRIPRNSMLSRHTVLWDGRVIGTWKRTLKKEAVIVELASFAPLTPAQSRAVRLAAERFAAFLGLPLEIQ